MDAISFTAGITYNDGRVVTVDVTAIDEAGITFRSEAGTGTVGWGEVKAAMLATTDHMLETGGSLLAMAEVLRETGDPAARSEEMRRFGLDVLGQAAPRVCPLGESCGLRPGPPGGGGAGPQSGTR
ncbi:MAG: hypothetical protein ACRD03_04200 [Acidimicrobiales bacterium]